MHDGAVNNNNRYSFNGEGGVHSCGMQGRAMFWGALLRAAASGTIQVKLDAAFTSPDPLYFGHEG